MLFIFDSHPVQYKAPVYQRMEQLRPGCFEVIYASDCSIRGHRDREFGEVVAWDTPLLNGYPHRILNNERGVPLSGFRSLTGRGIYRLLKKEKPTEVLLSQFAYEFDLAVILSCQWLRIPIWIRHETQDEAFRRPLWKRWARRVFYGAIYRCVKHAFYIGQLNREHLLRHGVPASRMSFAPYCVLPPQPRSEEEKQQLREDLRAQLSVAPNEKLLLFSGKLIDKKNPQLILKALALIPAEVECLKVVFVGSGELIGSLRNMVANTSLEKRVQFAGFVNQSKITDYYLAADILVLPSRRAGETWGLVVNEALLAGCAVVMTDAVGCHREFGGLERVRVIGEDDAQACANAISELTRFSHSFDWCAAEMEAYSVDPAAKAIVEKIEMAAVATDRSVG